MCRKKGKEPVPQDSLYLMVSSRLTFIALSRSATHSSLVHVCYLFQQKKLGMKMVSVSINSHFHFVTKAEILDKKSRNLRETI